MVLLISLQYEKLYRFFPRVTKKDFPNKRNKDHHPYWVVDTSFKVYCVKVKTICMAVDIKVNSVPQSGGVRADTDLPLLKVPRVFPP